MIGGQRVGKSSALAAIMDSFVNGEVRTILTAKDITSLAKVEGERQDSIKRKLRDSREFLSKNVGKTVMADTGKTKRRWNYDLELTLPGRSDSMTITFTDVSGELYEDGSQHKLEAMKMVKDYDVFIVAIDTPYMMESRCSDLVGSAANQLYNCHGPIQGCLSQIDDKDGVDAKLVIFVPIKCEKWARENKLDEVTKAVKEDFCTPIMNLSAYNNIQLEILPIQTLGSVFFVEHRETYRFSYTKKILFLIEREYAAKCSILDDGVTVRLSDGSERDVRSGKISADIEAVFTNSSIEKPGSWFKVETSEYRPHNCEQIAFHILDFMLAKVIDARIRKEAEEGALTRGLRIVGNFLLNAMSLGLWNKLKDIFGGITIKEMQDVIASMKSKKLVKYSDEGIEIIKKCNFKLN